MDAQQIKVFIDALSSSGLAELEVAKDGWTLRLVRDPVTGSRAATTGHTPDNSTSTATTSASEQAAALSGVVFLQPSPGEPAFVEPGQTVRAGQTVCVIEAMKVFNEVQAERDGTLDAFLMRSGQEIDAGQPLLRWR